MAKAWRCQREGSMFSHLFYLNGVLLSGAHADDVTGRTYILGVETKPV